MVDFDKTHLIVCTNPEALKYLEAEEIIIGSHARRGIPVGQGDAMVARDELQEQGFKWGKDFYIKKV